ncbi:ATP-binding protein [Hydrogenophaga sp.]|uniref:ATP-binding protein n=1 Tax=Hydrogenophaga sp. TaxID=1904254 RepID=UPI002736FC57|nr:ATP-binding protein [Hydrogenophaga sp.]MDP3887301.1 ATP-binding protein [Hydrogenophaga sp.]MDZ4359727.1 ATP-binding protein [Variovorax sp.]
MSADGKNRLVTLQTISLLVGVVATVLTPLVYFTTSNPPEVLAPALIALTGWVSLILLRKGYVRFMPHTLVFAVVLSAILAVLAHGSVRTAAGFLFVAAVAWAGIFLGRTALIATVMSCVAALGGLNIAEQRGWLHTPDFSVGITVWLTHSATLLVVAIMVYHSRIRAQQALTRQMEELERRKHTEQERDRSMERFARIFHTSPSAMLAQSAHSGVILDVNPAFERCYGHSRDQVLGRVDNFLWVDPEQRTDYLERLFVNRRALQKSVVGRRADGSTFDALISSEMGEDPEDRLVISTVIDISEERRRQTQLLSLTRGLSVPSGDALFHALTMHMAQAIGADMVTVGEQHQDRRVRTLSVWKDGATSPNFTFPLDGAPCGEAMQQTDLCVHLEGVAERYPHDQVLTDQGFQAYVGQSLRDEDGTAIGLLNALWRRPIQLQPDTRALIAIFASRATAELIRLRRDREILRLNASLEQRVHERTAELEKLNAELDSFAYSVSHDLKSPLRAIDGFTQLLTEQLQGRLQADEQQLFDRVLAATRRMSLLIADLLALARVSQGKLSRDETDLSALAEQVMRAEDGRHPERHLRWHITPDLVCQCDAPLARIVLENLLGNAVKYTRDQKAPLIEFGQLSSDGHPPGAFFVRDNGVGFNMHHADKLFKPFQRLHTPSQFEGTGIGLATVRRIVERHGGSIRGESVEGQGALFVFTLSAPPAPPPAPPPPAAPPPHAMS